MQTANQLPGGKLGEYELERVIGQGGMATVYRAYQPSLRRNVAIKVITAGTFSNPKAIERFQREVEVIAALEHPHILPIFDFRVEQGLSFLVMRLLEGGTVEDRIRNGTLTLPNTIEILDKISSALTVAHNRNIVHRDIKPNNVLMDSYGNPYLADFGIAKLLSSEDAGLTGTGMMIGTAGYMAPEIWRGDAITPQTDIYALGVMVFAMLTGKLPFASTTPFVAMMEHSTKPPPPLTEDRPDLPEALTVLLQSAMAKSPAERPTSATEFASDFRAILTPYLPAPQRTSSPGSGAIVSYPPTSDATDILPGTGNLKPPTKDQTRPPGLPPQPTPAAAVVITPGAASPGSRPIRTPTLPPAPPPSAPIVTPTAAQIGTQPPSAPVLIESVLPAAAEPKRGLPLMALIGIGVAALVIIGIGGGLLFGGGLNRSGGVTTTPFNTATINSIAVVPTSIASVPAVALINTDAPSATVAPTATPNPPTNTIVSVVIPTGTVIPVNTAIPASATTALTNTPIPPTATAIPTLTPVPASTTPIPPTSIVPTLTPVPPTPIPPTPTPILPTATSVLTSTPLPPTPTAIPVTLTLVPSTRTPIRPSATPLLPTATLIPTNTPIPPTSTPVPPTSTPVLPTATLVPTNTSIPPTSTPAVPTLTPIPPTPTPVLPTLTPIPTNTSIPPTFTSVPPTLLPPTPIPPTLTPTGTPVPGPKVVFLKRSAEGRPQIFSGDPGSTDPRQLTNFNETYLPVLSWSPDGTQIAFAVRSNVITSVYVIDANGDNAQRLTDGQFPQWSPDGTTIAYITGTSARYSVNVMSPEGLNIRQIATSVALFLAWQPSGKQLLYLTATGVYVTETTQGSQPRLLSNTPRVTRAAWSPDGTQVAFTDGRTVYLIPEKGGTATRIADGSEPAWSEDSQVLAFTRSGVIYTVAIPSGIASPQQITRGTAPLWLPGNDLILFTRGSDLFIFRLSDGTEALYAQSASAPALTMAKVASEP